MNELLEKWLAAYDIIPLGLSASEITNEYEYIFDILFNGLTISTMLPVSIGGLIYTRIEFNEPHTYKAGETIFIDDVNNYGRYNIFQIDTNQSIIVDYQEPKNLVGSPKVYRNVPYNMPPNLDGKLEVNLSPVLRTFVTENLVGTSSVYSGDKTRFCYELNVGERKKYEFNFTDNYFVSGDIGFIAEGTSFNDKPPFKVGDIINIQQEQYEWETVGIDFFVDPLNPPFVLNKLVFEDPTAINYGSGFETPFIIENQQLVVNGTTIYDGFTSIEQISGRKVVTNTPTDGAGLTYSVKVYGHMVPQYNGVATVVGLTYSQGVGSFGDGWVVITDKPFVRSTPAIGGKIVKSNGEKETIWDIQRQNERCVFNARRDHPDWKLSYEEYIIDGCLASSDWILANGFWNDQGVWVDGDTWNDEPPTTLGSGSNDRRKISTILNSNIFWRWSGRKHMSLIDFNAKADLLVHNKENNSSVGVMITGYDKSNSVVFKNFLRNNSGNELDYYAPIGLKDLTESLDLEPVSGFSSLTQSSTPDYYTVCAQKEVPQLNGTVMASSGNLLFRVSDADASVWFLQDLLQPGQTYTVNVGVFAPTGVILSITSDGFGNSIVEFDVGFPLSSELPGFISAQYCNSSECVAFEVDDCSFYEKWNVMFKDARGSWISYPFKLVSRDSLEVERSNFYKQEKLFDVKDYDRGEKSFVTRSRDKVQLTTDWVNDSRNYIIKDLFKSASVYVQDPDGRLYGAMIEDTDMEVRKDINEMIHNYELTFKLSRQNWRF